MNNNFYDIKDNWYKEFNNTFNANKNLSLANPKTAFLRGNLFNDLYLPYKNYKYGEILANTPKEELLYNILMHKFILTELNLYLDVHPSDNYALETFNKYLVEEKRLCNQYEKQYGPLTIDSENQKTNYWEWIKSPWPWEGTK